MGARISLGSSGGSDGTRVEGSVMKPHQKRVEREKRGMRVEAERVGERWTDKTGAEAMGGEAEREARAAEARGL